jgi:hypothetical protein
MSDTDWLDEQPDVDVNADASVASTPINLDNPIPEKNWVDWAGDALKHIGDGPTIDYIPILGPLYTKYKASSEPGDYDENLKRLNLEKSVYEKNYPESATVKAIAANAPLMLQPELAAAVKSSGPLAAAAKIGLSGLENALISGTDSKLRGKSDEEALDDAKTAAEWGAGLKAIPEVGKQAFRAGAMTVTGIKPKTIDRYIERKDVINEMTPESIHDDLSEGIQKIKDRGSHEMQKVDETYQRRLEEAKETAKLRREGNLERADILQRDVAERLSNDIIEARKKISKASTEAFNVLKNAGIEFDLTPIRREVAQMIRDRMINGKSDGTPEFAYLYKKYRELKGYGDSIPADKMKQLVQVLDDDSSAARLAASNGDRINSGAVAAIDMRRIYDSHLKTVPGYSEVMKKTSVMTKSLNDLLNLNIKANPDKIYNALSSIEALGKQDKLRAIQNFEKVFKVNYQDALAEAQAYKMAAVKPDYTRAQALREKGKAKVQAYLDPVKGKNPDQALNYLKRYGNNPQTQIPLGRDLEAIAKRQGKPSQYYKQIADDYAVQRAFQGESTNGSRNVNLFNYALGPAISTLAGAIGLKGGPVVAGMSAALGAAADKMGKPTVKAMIDVATSPAGRVFRSALAKAAQRGPQAIMATHYILLKNNPDYKNAIQDATQNPDQFQNEDADWLQSMPDLQE